MPTMQEVLSNRMMTHNRSFGQGSDRRNPMKDAFVGIKDWAVENPMDAGALALAPVPVVGDIAGFANDFRRMYQNPEERTWGNAALAGAGLLPFVPAGMGAIKSVGKKAASMEDALGGNWFSRIHPDNLPLTGQERGALLNYPTRRTAAKKLTSEAIYGGAIPENLRQDAVDFLKGMEQRHKTRLEMKDPGIAPAYSLLSRKPGHAKRSFKENLISLERTARREESLARDAEYVKTAQSRINSIKGRDLWSKSFANEVEKWSKYPDMGSVYLTKDMVNKANMEAIPRILKKDGWTMRHASGGRDGRASSRYIVSPDGKFEVRLSDHYLPDTPRREASQNMYGVRWDEEIVLKGQESPQDIIDKINRLHMSRALK